MVTVTTMGLQFNVDRGDLPPSSLSLYWVKFEGREAWRDQMFTRSIVRKQHVQGEQAISFQGHCAAQPAGSLLCLRCVPLGQLGHYPDCDWWPLVDV